MCKECDSGEIEDVQNIDEVQSLEIPTSTNGGLDEMTQLVTRAVPRIPLPPCCLLHVTTVIYHCMCVACKVRVTLLQVH